MKLLSYFSLYNFGFIILLFIIVLLLLYCYYIIIIIIIFWMDLVRCHVLNQKQQRYQSINY